MTDFVRVASRGIEATCVRYRDGHSFPSHTEPGDPASAVPSVRSILIDSDRSIDIGLVQRNVFIAMSCREKMVKLAPLGPG